MSLTHILSTDAESLNSPSPSSPKTPNNARPVSGLGAAFRLRGYKLLWTHSKVITELRVINPGQQLIVMPPRERSLRLLAAWLREMHRTAACWQAWMMD
jgi:hypothetical protein